MVEDIWLNFENYKLQLKVISRNAIKQTNDFADLEEPSSKIVELRRHSGSVRGNCSKIAKTKELMNSGHLNETVSRPDLFSSQTSPNRLQTCSENMSLVSAADCGQSESDCTLQRPVLFDNSKCKLMQTEVGQD